MAHLGGFYTCLYAFTCTGSWVLPWHCKKKKVLGMMQQDLSLHEGDRARGEVHGMQQCASIKGDIYLEMLRKSCLGSQKSLDQRRLCWEPQAIRTTKNRLHSENDPREVVGKILV